MREPNSISGDFAPDPGSIAPSDATSSGTGTTQATDLDSIGGRIGDILGQAIDILSFIAIGLGVLAIVLTGIYIITGVAANNSGNAAANLRRVIWVLGGLVIVFAAVPIVNLALSI